MLQIIRQLAKYGPITIEAIHGEWRVGCLVRLPAGVQEGFVKCYGDKLYGSLVRLSALAKEENQRLWEIQRAPKQEEFDYGAQNKDWEEIA